MKEILQNKNDTLCLCLNKIYSLLENSVSWPLLATTASQAMPPKQPFTGYKLPELEAKTEYRLE